MQIDVSRLDALIRAKTEPEPYSGVVLLSRGDETLFSGAYGLALRGEEIPNRLDTRFQIASGCKAFTAAAVLQHVAHGDVSLDTPLLDILAERASMFPHYTREIQIGHLLSHTSGITCYLQLETESDYLAQLRAYPVDTLRRPSDFVPMFADKPMRFAPGTRFEYNNAAFVLAALVVEILSGMSFPDYVAQHVFAPAEMADSGYFCADQLPGQVARAYMQDENGSWHTNVFAIPIVGGGDGGAYTTAEDMRRFWRGIYTGTLLGAGPTKQMLTPHVETAQEPPQGAYGLGVWIDVRDDHVLGASVVGGDPGTAMRSKVYGDRSADWDETVSLTMLANTSSAMWSLWKELESMLGIS